MPKVKTDPARAAVLRCSPIKIGANYFHLEVVSDDVWQEGEDFIGKISFRRKKITVRDTARGYVLVDTVFHECLHAIWNEGVLNLPDMSHAKTQELIASAYESGLAALFLDNPRLLKLFNHYWQPSIRKRKD